MIYLTLAIVSSMAVAVVMRLSEKRIRNNISMLASNYLMCSVLAGLYAGGLWGGFAQEGIGFAAGLGLVSGAFYLFSFMLYQWDIRVNGVTLSALFMKMGVIVSILTAVCFFGEVPGALQVAGMLIACAAHFGDPPGKGKQPREERRGPHRAVYRGRPDRCHGQGLRRAGRSIPQKWLSAFHLCFGLCAVRGHLPV